MLDVGCFHGLSKAGRQAYAARVEQLTAQGSELLLDAVSPRHGVGPRGISETDSRAHFDGWDLIDVEAEEPMATGPMRGSHFVGYRLRRPD